MLFTLPGAFATSGGTVIIGGGSMGLAPNDATYVTLSTNATLLNERVLTAGTGIALTDGGAGSTITVDVDATLVEILTSGNTTGGVDVEVTAGDALLFNENAAVPWTPAAGKGCVWVKNDAPNTIWFTDDAGTDFNLATGGETLAQTLAIGNTTGGTDLEVSAADALLFVENAAVPWTPAATKGCIWVKNDAPNTVWFTDDAGTDFNLATGGETLAQTLAIGNTTGGTGLEVSAADPLLLNENAAVPWTPAAGKGAIWVKNATPNELWFTDDAGTDFQLKYEGSAPAAHASSHQNGGADEISVAGLSGVLADAQTPIPTAGADTTAVHDDTAGEIAAVAAKGTPIGADYLLIEDSADGNKKKSITISTLPAAAPAAHATSHQNGGGDEISVAGLSGVLADNQNPVPTAGCDTTAIHDNVAGEIAAVAAKGTPVTADYLLIEDSADSNNKKSITIANLPAAAPAAHASTHQNGGADEISVAGLSGLLADTQTPTPTAGCDTTAVHDNVAGEIAAVAAKGTPVTADYLLIEDSADSNNKKSITIANLPAQAGADSTAIHDNVAGEIAAIAAKGTPTTSDYLIIEDAADSNNKKSITLGDIPAQAADTLAATLAAGSTSGGTDLEMSAGDALLLNENASVPWTPAAAKGCIWVKNATPNELYFTDDAGTDFQLGAGGGGGTALDANATSENLYCARTAMTPTVNASACGQVNLGSEDTTPKGTNANYATIAGGKNQRVESAQSTIGGGGANEISNSNSLYSTIAGGADHTISSSGRAHTIAGGQNHVISGSTGYGTIGGGDSNQITGTKSYATIAGGYANQITSTDADYNTICGGTSDTITGGGYGFIGGGQGNGISSGNNHNTIGGGSSNTITAGGTNVIGGGNSNTVSGGNAAIGGGYGGTVSGANGFIGSGVNNTVSASNGCIPGGHTCTVGGTYGFAVGRKAKADSNGSMVMADSRDQNVLATTTDELVIGMQNGIRLVDTTEEHGDVRLVRELQTSDGSNNNIYSETLADNSAMLITARIVGMESDGSDRATYILNALVYRDGAGATIQGATDRQLEIESDSNWTADIDVSSNDVIVYVNGNSDTVEWRCTIQKQQVT